MDIFFSMNKFPLDSYTKLKGSVTKISISLFVNLMEQVMNSNLNVRAIKDILPLFLLRTERRFFTYNE